MELNNAIYINGRFLTQKITGVQRFAYEITSRLVERKEFLFVIVIPSDTINPIYNTTSWKIIRIGKLKGHAWEQFELPLYLKSVGKPLLLNFCNSAPLYYLNKIVTIHDLAVWYHPQWFNKKFALFYKIMLPNVAKRSKLVLTVSDFSKNSIEQVFKINKDKIKVVYNAVSNEIYKIKDQEFSKTVLSKFSLNSNQYILSVSSLDPRKNQNNLIEAFNNLDNRELQLVLIGSGGKAFSDVRFKMQDNKNIKFLGYVGDEELSVIYRNALCFVYPSLFEGFGIPPLEAISCGCPTIVSNVTSLPEIFGNASLYIDPNDIASIIEKLIKIITSPGLRKELVEKGFEVLKKYNWSYSVDTIVKELSDLEN